MGNLDFSANADQLKELAAYMASQINVPTIGIGGGYAPIGTINFFDATVAPQDWLACDGSVYNIADYPQLADWYEAQHGSKNFYGGDGTTTFAVPDLQGEFLRGTGTNSHTNQGSGAALGVHQNGTYVPKTGTKSSGGVFYKQANDWDGTTYLDNITLGTQYGSANVTWTNMTTQDIGGTTRPTNTSFLICVKAVVAGEVYSTEERVVGTWIDGKKIYQKTYHANSVSNNQWTNIGNVESTWDIVDIRGTVKNSTIGYYAANSTYPNDTLVMTTVSKEINKVAIYCSRQNDTWTNVNITILYTKTTD